MEWLNEVIQLQIPTWVLVLLFAVPGIARFILDLLAIAPLKAKIRDLEADRDHWKKHANTFHDNAMKMADKIYRDDLGKQGYRFVNFVVAPEDK